MDRSVRSVLASTAKRVRSRCDSYRWTTVATGIVAATASGQLSLTDRRFAVNCSCPAAGVPRHAATSAGEQSASRPVHDVGATRRRAHAANQTIQEGVDFAVFRRSGQVGNPDSKASVSSFWEALEAMASHSDPSGSPAVILLGEVHDDVLTHRLQMDVLKHCAEVCQVLGRRLVLSLEMFERDVQTVLDEYVLKGVLLQRDLLKDSRPWANYLADYHPLVDFCRQNNIRVTASNAPRRYVSAVSRMGSARLGELLDKAPASSGKELLPPLPLPPASASYRQKFIETIASHMPAEPRPETSERSECPFIGFKAKDIARVRPEMLEAQLLWDHAMAQSIARSMCEGDDDGRPPLVLHICGAHHCAHGLGIPEVLPLYRSLAGAGSTTTSHPEDQMHVVPETPWRPIDSCLGDYQNANEATEVDGPSVVGSEDPNAAPESVCPKACPPGTLSVVCWPASVALTLKGVREGNEAQEAAISNMADWVIITEETYGE